MTIEELYKDIEPLYEKYKNVYSEYSKQKEELKKKEQELKKLIKELSMEQSLDECEVELLKKILLEAKKKEIESQLKGVKEKYEEYENFEEFSDDIKKLLNDIKEDSKYKIEKYCDVKIVQDLCKNCKIVDENNHELEKKKESIEEELKNVILQIKDIEKSKQLSNNIQKNLEDKKVELQNQNQNQIAEYCDLKKIKELSNSIYNIIQNLKKKQKNEEEKKRQQLEKKLEDVEKEVENFKENKETLFNSKEIEKCLEDIKENFKNNIKEDCDIEEIQQLYQEKRIIKLKEEQKKRAEEQEKKKEEKRKIQLRVGVLLVSCLFFCISLVTLKKRELMSKDFWYVVITLMVVAGIFVKVTIKERKFKYILWSLMGLMGIVSCLGMGHKIVPEKNKAEIILSLLIGIIVGIILKIVIRVTKDWNIEKRVTENFYSENVLEEIKKNEKYYFILTNFEDVKNELLSKEQYKVSDEDIKKIAEFDFIQSNLDSIKTELYKKEKNKLEERGIKDYRESYFVLINLKKIEKQLLDKERNRIDELVCIKKLKKENEERQKQILENRKKIREKIEGVSFEYQDVNGTLSNKIYIINDIEKNELDFELQVIELSINKKAMLFLYQDKKILNSFVPAFSAYFQLFNCRELLDMYIIDYTGAEKRSYNKLPKVISEFVYKNEQEKVSEVYEKIRKARRVQAKESSIDEYNKEQLKLEKDKQEFRKYMIVQFIFSAREEYTKCWKEELWNTFESAEEYGIIPIFYIDKDKWEAGNEDKEFMKELRKQIGETNQYVLESYLK